MRQRVFRTGHSLAVVVPAHFAKDTAIKAGSQVKVLADRRRGKITYIFETIRQLSIAFPKT